MKKKLSIFAAATLLSFTTLGGATLLSSCGDEEPVEKIETITISGEKLVEVGKSITLTSNVEGVTWSVTEGATITEAGVLTAGNEAKTVTVTAKKDGYKVGTYDVQITAKAVVDVTSVSIKKGTKLEVIEKKTLQLEASVLPENATDKTLTWSVTGEHATISNTGLLTAKEVEKDETVTVEAKSTNGKKDTVEITIKNEVPPVVEKIVISGENSVEVGSNVTLTSSVEGVTWTVTEGATITEAGVLTAGNEAKEVTVTATKEGYTAGTYKVTIVDNRATLTLTENANATIKASALTGKKDDEVTITATAKEGYFIKGAKFNNEEVTNTEILGKYVVKLAKGENVFTLDVVSLNGYTVGRIEGNPSIEAAETGLTIKNDVFKSNLVLKTLDESINKTNYSIKTHIASDVVTPLKGDTTELELGVVPYYIDDDNFLVAYIQWWKSEHGGNCRSMQITGEFNGNPINPEWQDIWLDGYALDAKAGFDFEVIRHGNEFTLKVNNDTLVKQQTRNGFDSILETAKVGFYSKNGTTTFTNVTIKEDLPEVKTSWSIAKGDGKDKVEVKEGKVLYEPGTDDNWKQGFAIRNDLKLTSKTTYKMSATVKGSFQVPITDNEKHIGFVPYYANEQNFLIVYVQWSKSADKPGYVRQVNIIGDINGQDIGWNDLWDFNKMDFDPTQGFTFSVERNDNTFTVKVNEITVTKEITKLEKGKETSTVGLWGNHTGLITFENLEIK